MTGNREIREWAKNVVRAIPAVHITNTDAVPTFKRRADACIDRAAVLLALEHATLPSPEPPPGKHRVGCPCYDCRNGNTTWDGPGLDATEGEESGEPNDA